MMIRKPGIETNLIPRTKVTYVVHQESLEDGKQSDLNEVPLEGGEVFNEFEVRNDYLLLF